MFFEKREKLPIREAMDLLVFALAAVFLCVLATPLYIGVAFQNGKTVAVGVSVLSANRAQKAVIRKTARENGGSQTKAPPNKQKTPKKHVLSRLRIALSVFRRLIRHIRLARVYASGTPGFSDAAHTALVCGAFGAALQALSASGIDAEGQVVPDFSGKNPQICVSGIFTARVGHIILAAVRAALIRIQRRFGKAVWKIFP